MVTYFREMWERDRLLVLETEGTCVGLVTFFLADSIEEARRLHQRRPWDTPQDSEQGTWFLIDWLMADKPWELTLRHQVQKVLLKHHPQVTKAVWYKQTTHGDREVIYKLKGAGHGLQD